MTTNLTMPGTPGKELSMGAVDRAKEEGRALARAQLTQFRQTWGGEAGTRYFLAGIAMHDAAKIHGLSGETLKRRVAELGLPLAVLPPESKETPEERYSRSLGPKLGKVAAALERENPLVCQQK